MISATDLSVSYDEAWVLHGVEMTLARGEILGLIGPPAAGKTVLLKTLAGLIQPDAGRLEVEGQRVDNDEAARIAWQQRIGMAFQNDALFDALTVYENVAFPLRRRRETDEQIDPKVRRRLEDVGLEHASKKYPSEVSGGMRKRAGIARATVIEPEVGFFDDPIAGLDPVTGARILELIVDLQRKLNMATVVISNDLPVLIPICTRLMMLHQGRVVYDGEPRSVAGSGDPVVAQFVTGADEGPL